MTELLDQFVVARSADFIKKYPSLIEGGGFALSVVDAVVLADTIKVCIQKETIILLEETFLLIDLAIKLAVGLRDQGLLDLNPYALRVAFTLDWLGARLEDSSVADADREALRKFLHSPNGHGVGSASTGLHNALKRSPLLRHSFLTADVMVFLWDIEFENLRSLAACGAEHYFSDQDIVLLIQHFSKTTQMDMVEICRELNKGGIEQTRLMTCLDAKSRRQNLELDLGI